MHIISLSITGVLAESIRNKINKELNSSFSEDLSVRFISDFFDYRLIETLQQNKTSLLTYSFSTDEYFIPIEKKRIGYYYSEGILFYSFIQSEKYISLKELKLYCDSIRLYEILEECICNNLHLQQQKEVLLSFIEIIKELLIEELLKIIFLRFSEFEQKEAFNLFFNNWKRYRTDIICKLAEKYNNKKKELSQILQKSSLMQFKKRPIKTIAFFSRQACNGGTERVTASLCNMFTNYTLNGKSQFKVILITEQNNTTDDYPLSSQIIRIVIPNCKTDNYHIRANFLNSIIKEYNIDLYINNILTSPLSFWDLLTIKSNNFHPAYLSYCHFIFALPFATSNSNSSMDFWYTQNLADGIITLNQIDKNFWSSINSRTYMVKNPCQFSNTKIKKNSSQNKDILWVARVDAGKNVEDVFLIMEEVIKEIPDAVCRIVGKGKPFYIEKLLEERKRRNLEKNIIFEGFYPNVEEYYKSARVFLSTSEIESYSLTIYESAAFGIPLVAYELPYLEYFKSFKGWTTVPQRDTHSAAQSIIKLLKDDEYWNEKSIQTYDSFQKSEQTSLLQTWLNIISDLNEEKPAAEETPFYHTIDQLLQFQKQGLDNIYKIPGIARIDIKNIGSSDNDVQIISCSDTTSLFKPVTFLCDKDGNGQTYESESGAVDFTVKTKGKGTLKIWLRSPHIKNSRGASVPFSIGYTKFTVNNINILKNPCIKTHDKPYIWQQDVNDGDFFSIHIEWNNSYKTGIEFEQEFKINEKKLQEKDLVIHEKDSKLKEKDKQIQDQNKQIQEQNKQIHSKDTTIQEKDRQINELKKLTVRLKKERSYIKVLLYTLKHHGVKTTLKKVKDKIRKRLFY